MSTPDYSIVIPTFNRPGPLKQCLTALAGLAMDRDAFEVIVVDDHSPESQQSMVMEFEQHLDLVFIRQPVNQGPAAARNRGAEMARGQYICFTDDDCMPHEDWLTAFGQQFKTGENVMLGGHTINVLADNAYSQASQVLVDYLYERLTTASGVPTFFTSNNICLPLRLFRETGGFDTGFPRAAAEDREFGHRFRELGYDLVYTPGALVRHAHELGFRSYLRQHFFYGTGALQFRSLMRKNNLQPPRIEPLKFYTGMMTFPFSKMGWARAVGCSFLLLLSQLANTAGFFWQARQKS